jgi:hypothetical protein
MRRFKFLLHLGGISSPPDLSDLLLVDSPVLKEESEMGEWFSRSLKPLEHYIPIFK